MRYANTATTSYFVHDTNNIGFYSYKTIVTRYSLSDKCLPEIQVSRHTVMVDRGCWRPRTVHSGVTSDIKGMTERVRFTLLWCCCSLPLTGVQVSKPVMLCIRDKTGWRRSQQRRFGCMVLLDSFLSLLGLCRILSLLRARAWQVVVSLTTEGTCSKLEVEHHPARATVAGI